MEPESITANIEKEPGNYVLVLYNKQQQTIEVGKLGIIELKQGYYLYVGSALGPGGVQARVNRHSQQNKKMHWHIDYLRAVTTLKEIWYLYSKQRYEHYLAELLQQTKIMSVPLMGFGASDCDCQTHLFYSEQKPNFVNYKENLSEEIDLLKLNYK